MGETGLGVVLEPGRLVLEPVGELRTRVCGSFWNQGGSFWNLWASCGHRFWVSSGTREARFRTCGLVVDAGFGISFGTREASVVTCVLVVDAGLGLVLGPGRLVLELVGELWTQVCG